MVAEEGRENRWERHRLDPSGIRPGSSCEPPMHVADPANRLWTLNTPRVPEGVADAKIRAMLEQRGIEIAGGFGPLPARSSASG